ncbi:glycosyltransferase family 4 protein [Elizabethkingia sp. JS20170427COW]|uniref:glycosyltransferase family 4 protein n=1 Tax=Elizabethkingia sp. JS20170427COW TaxID=2583851 RepID=UPI001110A5F7|nr:glycosyltransferase family 4 protein [Elizabethkingia sp. JS20170427COW]QCX53430.1 glycosyltransferase family 4 protein [Elizabethkingia sp. JS20170427COW]
MKIGFICKGDPQDKKTWSGTTYKMFQAIKNLGYSVVWIPGVEYSAFEKKVFEKTASLHEKLLNRTYNRHQNIGKAIIASRKMQLAIHHEKPDILFAVGTINELALLKTSIPIVYLNDILYDQHINYYPAYMGLGWYSKKTLRFLEKKVLQKCAAVILPSEWSIERAETFYHLSPEKLHLLRFGANIEVPNKITYKKLSSEITFLFLGVEWERKGGDIALATIELLAQEGYPVKLKVVGCIPPRTSEVLEVIPFLNKNNPSEYQQLKDILLSSDFLFLPTRAECYGIVFCEASAYGLPSITTATGGVTSIVKNGINGYALPLQATPQDYAEVIKPLLQNPKDLFALKENSRKRYEESLTWELWQQQLGKILNKIKNEQ